MKRMKLATLIATALSLTACAPRAAPGTPGAAVLSYRDVVLSGANEVPPVASTATGTATARLEGNTLSVVGRFEGLGADLYSFQGSPAHLHLGSAGENGPLALPLEVEPFDDGRSGELGLRQPLTPEQAETFRAGGYYINIHTLLNHGGELRGQLRDAQPGVTRYDVRLSGDVQVPPVTTAATGEAAALLVGDVLTVTGRFEGLTGDLTRAGGSAVHLHAGRPGRRGPVVLNLGVEADVYNFNFRDGSFIRVATLEPAQARALREGGLYLDVHSAAQPGGELRAQLAGGRSAAGRGTLAETVTYFADFAGGEAVPPVDTAARGAVRATLAGNALRVSGIFAGLQGDLYAVRGSAAYVYEGAESRNGRILFPLAVEADPDGRGGVFNTQEVLTSEQVRAFLGGDLYVGISTEYSQNGELRAQLAGE